MPRILIVEDEDVIRLALRRLLERNDYQVDEAGSVQEALERFDLNSYQLLISDLRLPGAPGTELISKTERPVLIMTSYASLKSAVDSMKQGAIDYIAKPFDHDEMLETVARIIADNASNPPPMPGQQKALQVDTSGMIGSCKPMQRLYEYINRVAPTDTTVLVHGETGTGKELVARAIHSQSTRASKPIVCVNCAAIPETLIESELFGYEKGAFTGANANRIGLIEAADGGTLFLDEIGELPLEAQARLLRFIQEDEIRRIGSVESNKVDVRLICATHRDLKDMAHNGRFREDLYYRINVMKLELPPLRERGKDILEIAETLLSRRCEALGRGPLKFSPKAIQAITTYVWPGNIRELENAVERAVILCEGDEIDNELLDIDLELVDISQIRGRKPERNRSSNNLGSDRKDSRPSRVRSSDPAEDLSLEDYFQRFVLEHQDSMSETELAQKLGVSRKCLWERRQRLGIPRKKSSRSSSN
ncbi:sigma-54-dependent transcriptional regulator [Spongiibacter sp. UBA1325]|jgi:DNA-binding NtrC family response regulator|uniref:sigma-54-dependent transcriptional regulator n=1 Tax=Spongiibacter sp. UBA1325 TaxID=1947543 RepID=UPI00257BC971|nr:sigma-54 dependent transcriptional regulator [Spongiibacter sp. UBA1325]|tara:strand:+ start:9658 stop:11091 length:1434 start_codon:yes stop_codon:yes gene_type:complete